MINPIFSSRLLLCPGIGATTSSLHDDQSNFFFMTLAFAHAVAQ